MTITFTKTTKHRLVFVKNQPRVAHLQLSVTQHTRLSTHWRHSEEELTRPLTQEITSPVMPSSGTGIPVREPAAASTGTRQPGSASVTESRQGPPHLRHPPSELTLNTWPRTQLRPGHRRARDVFVNFYEISPRKVKNMTPCFMFTCL